MSEDLQSEWEAAGDDPSVNLLLRTVRNLLREGNPEGALSLLDTAISLSGPTEPTPTPEPACDGRCMHASDFIDCAPDVVAYPDPWCSLHGDGRPGRWGPTDEEAHG